MCHSFIQLRSVLIYWGLCLPNQGFLHPLAREHLGSFHCNEKEISDNGRRSPVSTTLPYCFFRIILVRYSCLAVPGLRCFAGLAPGRMGSGLWVTGSGAVLRGPSCSVPRGIFPAQGSNPWLPHCRQIPDAEPPGKHPAPLFSSKSNGQPSLAVPSLLSGLYLKVGNFRHLERFGLLN